MFFTSKMKVVIARCPSTSAGSSASFRQHDEAGGVVGRVLDLALRRSRVRRDRPPGRGRSWRRCRACRFPRRTPRRRRYRHGEADDAALLEEFAATGRAPADGCRRPRTDPAPSRHQAMGDAHEMLGHDRQAAGRKQEMDVGHPAMLAVLDQDHRTAGRAAFDRFERIFEAEAGQRQASGANCIAAWCGAGSGGPANMIARAGSAAAAARIRSTRARAGLAN